jgi:raffinose/stachyose/melibiose transport system permease protein
MIRKRTAGARILEVVMLVVALLFLSPLVILINISLKPSSEALHDPLALPTSVDFTNFAQAWAQGDLGTAVVNSAVIAGLSVVVLVLLGSTAAFYFARKLNRVSTVLYFVVLLGLMIPLQLGMVPLYRMMSSAGLLGTYTSLILFYAGSQLPFTVFLYAGFLRATPRDFEEAAHLDGAGWWSTFWFVVFPLVRPVTVTVVLLDMIDVWKDFLTPLLYVGGSAQQTLPVAIYAFQGEFVSQWGIIFAGVIISIIPIMVIYIFLQRFIIGGFAGGLKG